MLPDYEDIRSRIKEPPAWYDIHGVPRYGAPPEALLPFMRGIACQDCGEQFRVCLVGEVYFGLYGEYVHVGLEAECPHEKGKYHVKVEARGMRRLDKNREWENLPLPDDWGYGDPPSHGCVGDCMSSIPDYEWEEWEKEKRDAMRI